MVESFSTLTITVFVYFAYCLYKSKHKEAVKYSLLTALSFLPMAFSKMNVIFILPIFLLGFFFLSAKKVGYKKSIPLSALAFILSISFILISMNAPASSFDLLAGDASTIRSIPVPKFELMTPLFFPVSIVSFFDFPPISAFEKMAVIYYTNI